MVVSDSRYAFPATANVSNFVTVKPCLKGDGRISSFRNWKEQMVCLLESQDVVGFVDGEIPPPPEEEQHYKDWTATDRLVKGWILGSVDTDLLDALPEEKQTARDLWLHLDDIFMKEEKKGDDFIRYVPLYKAALRGDWNTAESFFQDTNELSSTIITSNSETALHIAVLTGNANNFVNKLLEIMPRDALALKDSYGETALHIAAYVGNTEAAVALVNKNPDLLRILGSDSNRMPVLEAAISCQRETLEYLISEHEGRADYTPFQGQPGVRLLNAVITSQYVDIALDLVQKYPYLSLLTSEDISASSLSTIAEEFTLFPRIETLSWCQKFIYHRIPLNKPTFQVARAPDIENLVSDGVAHKRYSASFQIISAVGQKLECVIWYVIEILVPTVKEMRETKTKRRQALQLVEYLCDEIASQQPEKEVAGDIFSNSIIIAAKHGISEIVEMIMHKFPLSTFDYEIKTGRNIFMLATSYRHENVINLIYNMSDRKYMFFNSIDNENNNLLHICAKLAPPTRLNLVAGPALQMQRELQWFKEMEKLVRPPSRTWINNEEKQTPQMIFTEEHERLKEDGERWMKDTANACTIAATLIATVMFSAAFTVPGGVESATAVPIFTDHAAFGLFVVSDAISLFSSITSLLMFLSILTSRYAEQDFLHILPKRLSMGLLSLFVSIIFMLVAFAAAFYLLLQRDKAWFVVLTTFACLPVASFVLLQFPLLVDVVYSTFGPGIFGKKTDRLLY